MKKKYRLATTRPEFMAIMAGGVDEARLEKTCCDGIVVDYVAYTAMMNANVDRSKISAGNNDGSSIAFTFEDKETARDVVEACETSPPIRYGKKRYRAKAKARGSYVVITAEPVDGGEESDREEAE